MEKAKISIIVPVYNAEKYLYNCIDSIINQSYNNLEIILINDGSTDNSLLICKEFASKDSRIIIIDKENGKVSSARNAGLDIVTGDYIGFVDSDDYIANDMYEVLISIIIKNDADVVECGYYEATDDYKVTKKNNLKKEITVGDYNCSYNYVRALNTTKFCWNKLFTRNVFKSVRFKNVRYWEDYLVNAEVFKLCNKKVTIEGCYYYYVRNTASITLRKFDIALLDMIDASRLAIDFYNKYYPSLRIYADFNMLIAIRHLYKRLRASSDSLLIEKYSDYLKKLYIEHYPFVKKRLYELSRSKVNYIAFKLFYYSPDLYCIALERTNKWL